MTLGPKQMGEAIIRNLKLKTGKSIEEWIKILKETNHLEKKEAIAYLKNGHGVGHFQAQKIFEMSQGEDEYGKPMDFIPQLFDTKNSMKLYEAVKSQILDLGEDIRIQPCRTYIPFYRKKQFLLLTKTGNDKLLMALNLPAAFTSDRFEKCSIGSVRINQGIRIKDVTDVDDEVKNAMRIAYNRN